MKTRLITAGVATAVAILLITLGSLYSVVVTIALALVSVILCGEFMSARKLNKNMKVFIPALAFALLIPALSATEARYIPLFLFIFGMCVLAVVFHRSLQVEDVMYILFGVTVTTVSDLPLRLFWSMVFT